MRHRRAIVTSVLAVLVLFIIGLSVLFAGGTTPQYDTNSSGVIEQDEAHNALRAYFDGDLTQEQTLDVLFHYWAAQPVDQPAPAASSQPTPTATPTAAPTTTPTATSIPAPTLSLRLPFAGHLEVNWRHNAYDVTGYELRYRLEGGAWRTLKRENKASISGADYTHSFSAGDRFEVQFAVAYQERRQPMGEQDHGGARVHANPDSCSAHSYTRTHALSVEQGRDRL